MGTTLWGPSYFEILVEVHSDSLIGGTFTRLWFVSGTGKLNS